MAERTQNILKEAHDKMPRNLFIYTPERLYPPKTKLPLNDNLEKHCHDLFRTIL